MHTLVRASIAAMLAIAALQVAPARLHGHAGEDHGNPTAPGVAITGMQGDVLTTTGVSDYFEVVAKYPATDAGDDVRVRLFIADFATNQPIVDAVLKLAFKPAGVTIRRAPTMIAPGIYDVVLRYADDGTYTLVLTITAGQRTDFVEVRDVHAGDAAHAVVAEHATASAAPAATSNGLSMLAIAAIAVGALAVIAALIAVRRRRARAGGNVARDPELAGDPSQNRES